MVHLPAATELADKAASVFTKVNDDQLRRRIAVLERELETNASISVPASIALPTANEANG